MHAQQAWCHRGVVAAAVDTASRSSKVRFSLLTLLILAAGCAPTGNEQYPARSIEFIVPWNAGGGTDTGARALAPALRSVLGQPVTVVNRTGGGGVVGHMAIARANPDGYTLGAVTVEATMMHWIGLTEVTPADYEPLAVLMINPSAVTVRADAPWTTLDELLDDVRENPGVHFASGTSRGGIWDLARIGMLEAAGIPPDAMPWVPSQGAAPALQELLAGGVAVVTAAFAETASLRGAGRVRTLAVMADERLPSDPTVPTLTELGLPWSVGGWLLVSTPAGIPDAVRDTLVAAIDEATAMPAYRDPLLRAGYNLVDMSGSEAASFMAQQDSTNHALLEQAGLTR